MTWLDIWLSFWIGFMSETQDRIVGRDGNVVYVRFGSKR
jgi:hypothetical protein